MTLNKHFFTEFLSLPTLGMGYSEIHRIPPKEHFFPQNNVNRSKFMPRNIFGMNFDGNSRAKMAQQATSFPLLCLKHVL
jgi:hypothetical protein